MTPPRSFEQGGNLPCLKVSSPVTFDSVFRLPFFQMRSDWFGKECCESVLFTLALTDSELYFAVRVGGVPDVDPEWAQDSFVEGLWARDVAELFIADPQTGSYREFNLSPSGAWWSALFHRYRERTDTIRIPGIKASSSRSKGEWIASLAIPNAAIFEGFTGGVDHKMNVSFIIGGARRQHVSWGKLNLPAPDFHRAELFNSLEMIQL